MSKFLSNFFCQMTVRQKGRWLLSFDRRNSRIEWETTIVIMWHGSPSHPRLSLKPRGERDQIGLSSFRKSTQKGNPKSHFSWLGWDFHEISMFVFTQIFSRDLNSWQFFKIWQKWQNEWAKTTRTLSSWHCFLCFYDFSWGNPKELGTLLYAQRSLQCYAIK